MKRKESTPRISREELLLPDSFDTYTRNTQTIQKHIVKFLKSICE